MKNNTLQIKEILSKKLDLNEMNSVVGGLGEEINGEIAGGSSEQSIDINEEPLANVEDNGNEADDELSDSESDDEVSDIDNSDTDELSDDSALSSDGSSGSEPSSDDQSGSDLSSDDLPDSVLDYK